MVNKWKIEDSSELKTKEYNKMLRIYIFHNAVESYFIYEIVCCNCKALIKERKRDRK